MLIGWRVNPLKSPSSCLFNFILNGINLLGPKSLPNVPQCTYWKTSQALSVGNNHNLIHNLIQYVYSYTHKLYIYIYNYIYGICPFICGFYIFKFFLVISIYICVCIHGLTWVLTMPGMHPRWSGHEVPPPWWPWNVFPELLPGAEHGAPQLSQRHRRVAKKKGIEMRMSQSFWAYGTTDFRICWVLIILVGGLEDGFYFSICWE